MCVKSTIHLCIINQIYISILDSSQKWLKLKLCRIVNTDYLILAFSRQHIANASYMDMFRGVENTPLYPRNIPDVATFQMNARGSLESTKDVQL